MAEFAGDVLAKQAIGERQNGNQRQRPADGAARHFQHAHQQNKGDQHLQPDPTESRTGQPARVR
jgi:hypothetical protein